jgi:lipoprotein signal peptidase
MCEIPAQFLAWRKCGIRTLFFYRRGFNRYGVFGYLFFKNDFRDRRRIVYSVGLTLLIAGTFGNAIDRMVNLITKSSISSIFAEFGFSL